MGTGVIINMFDSDQGIQSCLSGSVAMCCIVDPTVKTEFA